jgi:hypothetical protein
MVSLPYVTSPGNIIKALNGIKNAEIYRKFRNPASSGAAITLAIRTAYAPLYLRNEFMHELGDAELLGLVVEETGEAHDSNPVKLTVSCIKYLKQFASFTSKLEQVETAVTKRDEAAQDKLEEAHPSSSNKAFGINLGYTINLNLPATTDPAVFDAIFKSLKEYLLSAQDG